MVAVALKSDLMGLGLSASLANLVGAAYATVTGVGTSQSGAAALTGTVNNVTTSAGQTATVLSSSWPLMVPISVYTNTATTALVFPPSGATINQGAADASVNVAQGKMTTFIRVSNLAWLAQVGA